MIEAELPDGTVLEFPEGTSNEVIQATVQKMMGIQTAPQRSMGQEVGRQLGLTARYGLEGVGGVLDVLSSPFRAGLNAVLPESMQIRRGSGESLSAVANLPQPETSTERIVGDISRTMAGAGGAAGVARGVSQVAASPVTRAVAERLGSTVGVTSSAGAGAGQGLARESGLGETGQLVSGLVGGIAAPASFAAGRMVAEKATDAGTLLAASLGNKRAITKVAGDAAERIVGDQKQQILAAIKNRTEFVPGARPTVSEAIAQQNLGQPRQTGGAVVKLQEQLTGASGMEDLLPSVARRQEAAIKAYEKSIGELTAPLRETAIARANVQGVTPNVISYEIDKILNTPGKRASEVVNKALLAIQQKIGALPRNQNGTIDANDLYTVRKEVGNTIAQFSKETANWDKKLAAGLEKSVQRYIDDAIEKAGAGGSWKEYLNAYSKGMKNIEAQLSRQEEAKRIANIVRATSLKDTVAGELPQAPNLLSRPATIINYVVKNVLGDVNTPVAKELARRLADPDEFAKLLQRPAKDPFRIAAQKVLSESVVANFSALSEQ